MINKSKIILIGPINNDQTESVSSVNKSFIKGLSNKYEFIKQRNDRSFGIQRLSQVNFFNSIYFIRQVIAWTWLLIKERPDIAHYSINSGWSMEKSNILLGLAKRMGALTIGHLHSGSFLNFWKQLPLKRKQRAYTAFLRLNALIVLSDNWKSNIVRFVGIPENRIHVVNNPIDEEFEKQALQMGARPGNANVLALGVMGKDKGILDIIMAMRNVAGQINYKAILAGPEREPGIYSEINKLIEKHNLQSTIQTRTGLWGKDKINCFRECSISLLPSYYENFPLFVIEAAAAGHAIIASPVGAVAEFFENEVSALFVDPGKPDQIARALVRLNNDIELRDRLGRTARDIFIKRLQRSSIMNSLDKVYQIL